MSEQTETAPQERTDEPELPKTFDPAEVADCGPDTIARYQTLREQTIESETPAQGSEDLILSFDVPAKLDSAFAIQLSQPKSLIWQDREHIKRIYPDTFVRAGIDEIRVHLPWEWWGWSAENITQTDGRFDEHYQNTNPAIGVPWPEVLTDTPEFRLLHLLPHDGDLESPVELDFVMSQLNLHSCYIAVRDSRGAPSLKGTISVDEKEVQVSKNLELFLRYMRSPHEIRVLWIRELCINKENEDERQKRFNRRFQQFVENCSCGILRMDEVMAGLIDAGHVKPGLLEPRKKVWDDVVDEYAMFHHRPHQLWAQMAGTEGEREVGEAKLYQYTYTPLDLVADEIRLVTLYPADDDDDYDDGYDSPLVADIGHVPLYGKYPYVALSYTWGDSTLTDTLHTNGQSVKITHNLSRALRDIRLVSSDFTVLWIDALCIDQANPQEKSRHIPRMQQIYDAASGVFIVPGPGEPFTLGAYDFMRELAQKELTIYELDENGAVARHEAEDGSRLPVLKSNARLARAWADLYRFLTSRYFGRRWIVQELSSASAPTVVLPDKIRLPFRGVVGSAECLMWLFDQIYDIWLECYPILLTEREELATRRNMQLYNVARSDILSRLGHIQILSYVRQLRTDGTPPSFLFLAILTQSLECMDEKDRIYGIWSIVKERHPMNLRIDYALPTVKVYTDHTMAYALHTGSLDIICAAQAPIRGPRASVSGRLRDLESDMPTWAVDWREKPRVSCLVRDTILENPVSTTMRTDVVDYPPFSADGLLRYPVEAGSPESETPNTDDLPFAFSHNTLQASGVILDSIKYIADLHEAYVDNVRSYPPYSWLALALQHYRLPDGSQPSVTQIHSDFNSIMLGLPTGHVNARPLDPDDLHGTWTWKHTPADDRKSDRRGRGKPFLSDHLSRTETLIKGRKFVITEHGHMGLAPWYVRPGFKIAILLGCSVPVLLERVSRRRGSTATGSNSSFSSSSASFSVSEEEPFDDSDHDNDDDYDGDDDGDDDDDDDVHGREPGLYFRGDCFVQGWMHGELLLEKYGSVEKAWHQIRELPRLDIR